MVELSHASTSNPEKASSFIATSRNVGKALHTSVSHSEWIIDSGATNHMTFDNNHIQSIKSFDQHIVSTADGTPSPVLGERENRDECPSDEAQTLHHPLDNLDFIRGDNLEISGECPSDGITMDNREECPGETGDGLEFFEDENQGQMEVQNQMEVPSVS
ncbi:Retrovirus-related Pol polyprotein from transposon RE1 [Fagus crenata]